MKPQSTVRSDAGRGPLGGLGGREAGSRLWRTEPESPPPTGAACEGESRVTQPRLCCTASCHRPSADGTGSRDSDAFM